MLSSVKAVVKFGLVIKALFSNLGMILPVVAEIIHFQYFEVVFRRRSSSFEEYAKFGLVF